MDNKNLQLVSSTINFLHKAVKSAKVVTIELLTDTRE
jgi:hypothetical protein